MIDRFAHGLTIAEQLAEPAEIEPDELVEERPVDERVRRAVLALIAGDREARDVRRIPRRG